MGLGLLGLLNAARSASLPRRFEPTRLQDVRQTILWITGWAVPAGQLRRCAAEALPEFDHQEIPAEPGSLAAALASTAGILGGFSFGAHLLLHAEDPRRRFLLAPFADLKKEAGLGGAVATTQLRQQLRWVKRDPDAALADFRARIGAEPPASEENHDRRSLLWGLEQMLAPGRAADTLPSGSLAIAGEHDPLLDTGLLARGIPGLRVIDAGHQMHPLLAELARLRQIDA